MLSFFLWNLLATYIYVYLFIYKLKIKHKYDTQNCAVQYREVRSLNYENSHYNTAHKAEPPSMHIRGNLIEMQHIY